jgi:hypothetical protein
MINYRKIKKNTLEYNINKNKITQKSYYFGQKQ